MPLAFQFFTANPALALESGIYVYEKKIFWADIDHRPSTVDHRPSTIGRRTTTRPIFKGVDQSEAAHYIIMSAHIIILPSLPQGGGWRSHPRGRWRSNSIGGGEVPHPPWRGGLPGDLLPGDPPGGSPGGGPQSGDLFFSLFSLFFCCFFHLFFTPQGAGPPHLN